jgi:predicted PurR-regulated permease PerM
VNHDAARARAGSEAQPEIPSSVDGTSSTTGTTVPDRSEDSARSAAGPVPTAATPAVGGKALRTAIFGLFGIATVGALYLGRPILMPVLVAMLLSLLLSPLVTLLERVGLGRPLASLAVVVTALVLVGLLALNLAAPARQWIETAPERVDQLREKVRMLRAPVDKVKGATDRVAEIANDDAREAPREVVIERRWSTVLLENAQSTLINALIVVILLYFLLSSGDLFLRKLIRVVPTLGDKIRAIEISRTIQTQIGRYFAAVTMINAGLGIVVAVAMAALGMPTPALLGAVAAILNFVPYLGSLVALSLVSIVSVLTFDTVPAMLLPPAVYLVCTVVEGQVVQPIVLGRHLSTAPVVIFVWVLSWGWLWGVGGVVIAVPLLVVAKICADHLPSWKPLAEFLGRD